MTALSAQVQLIPGEKVSGQAGAGGIRLPVSFLFIMSAGAGGEGQREDSCA